MGLLKRLGRSRPVQEAIGFLLAGYLGLVRRTGRFVMEPADAYDRIGPQIAGHRCDVAWSAFHDSLRQASAGQGCEPRFALR